MKSLTCFLLVFICGVTCLAQESPYYMLVEKNPFSPERKYTPSETKKNGSQNIEESFLKRQLLLRGTFQNEKGRFAIIQVKPALKRKFEIQKDRLILKEGQKVGECVLEEIKRGKVSLGGACKGVEISLADNPERSRPLPPVQTPVRSAPLSKGAVSKSPPRPSKRGSHLQNLKGPRKSPGPSPANKPPSSSHRKVPPRNLYTPQKANKNGISNPFLRILRDRRTRPKEGQTTTNPFLEMIKKQQ